MSKRADLLKGMFSVTPAADPAVARAETAGIGAPASGGAGPGSPGADTASGVPSPAMARPRTQAGAVKSMGLALGSIESENERLRALLATGAQVVEIDPEFIAEAPVRDRFEAADPAAFEALKASIAAHGQEVPILVRPVGARFQVAYGHRRLAACRDLGLKVRAVVRPLTDLELVLAQGLENSARHDLTWIERACFARALEAAGYERSVIQEALSTDKTELSRMISTANAVPDDVLRAIGPAPKTGRPRWMAFAAALPERLPAVRATMAGEDFAGLDSDARVVLLTSVGKVIPASPGGVILLSDTASASVRATPKAVRLTLDHPRFGAWLAERLPDLFKSFEEADTKQDR